MVRYSGWATYQGGLLGIPPTNRCVLETGILIYGIEGGKVQELWSEMSDLQVVMQLGAFPMPEEQQGDDANRVIEKPCSRASGFRIARSSWDYLLRPSQKDVAQCLHAHHRQRAC